MALIMAGGSADVYRAAPLVSSLIGLLYYGLPVLFLGCWLLWNFYHHKHKED